MSTILLNDPGCSLGTAGNTATPQCAFNPGLITGLILIPKYKVIALTTQATFISDMQALCLAGTATRAYPLYGFVGMEDKTPDQPMVEKGYGGKQPGPVPRRNFVLEHTAGGLCHQLQLMKFNNDNGHSVLLIDQNNIIIGTKTSTAGQITGISLEYFNANPVKWGSGKDAPAMYKVDLGFGKPREMNEDIAFFDLGSSPEDSFQGCLDIEMYDLGAGSATKKQVIGIRSICDKVSLYDAFSATLVSAYATIFSATLAGAAANPTGAVAVPTLKGIELTFGATGVHVISMASPAVLSATPNFIGIQPSNGFECLTTLSVTVA